MDPGIFAFYIACDEPKADRALQGLLEQINLDTRKAGHQMKNLSGPISNLIGEYLINLQSSWSRAENTALNTLYGLGYDYDKEYVKEDFSHYGRRRSQGCAQISGPEELCVGEDFTRRKSEVRRKV